MTKSIIVNIAAYNPVTVRFTNTRVHFEYSKGGSVEITSDTQALAVGIYDEFSGSLLLAMEVIVLCWVIYSTYALITDSIIATRSSDFKVLKKLEKNVVKIHSNILEVINLCCQLAAFIIWWVFQALYAYRFSVETIRCVPDCDGTKSTFYDAFQEPDWERHRRRRLH